MDDRRRNGTAARRAGAWVSTGAALALALSGCVAGFTPPQPTATSARPKPAPALPTVSFATPVPNDPAQRKNAALTSCQKGADGWTASGTAKNPDTAKVLTYLVTVSFATTGGTVLDRASTTISVRPGATATWQITGAQDFADQDLRCILRGVALAP